MGYWGWRSIALLMCLSVWVVSCTDHEDTTAPIPPTDTPANMFYTPPSGDIPPDEDLILPITVTPMDARDPFDVAATLLSEGFMLESPINIHSPTCYELASGGIICTGQVTNPAPTSVSQVRILTQIYNRDGSVLAEQVHMLSQWHIPTDETATYTVVFPPEDTLYLGERFGGARSTVIGNVINTNTYITLDARVERLQSAADGTQVGLTVSISNPANVAVDATRLHITLLDPDNRVAAYRVVDVVDADTVDVILLPQLTDRPLTARVYAEGRRTD